VQAWHAARASILVLRPDETPEPPEPILPEPIPAEPIP